jgi:SAM-dependent MidA family methyltransferase
MNSRQLSDDPGQQALYTLIQRSIDKAGGWLGFERFMALALYAPGLGYYANHLRKFGTSPQSGSDFVTAPELSVWFGRTLTHQIAEALQATQTDTVWEFGAGSGALALQLLDTLGDKVSRYTIVATKNHISQIRGQSAMGRGTARATQRRGCGQRSA